jgi:DNA-binding transcriptional LysR family regulator
MALFVEVAKAMSFRRASEATGVPTSSLSRRIAELEQAVGVQLLNRNTRSIELTEAGAVYYERCKEIVAAARLAHEELTDAAERPSGRLRVSTTVEFARLFLPNVIALYTENYPKVTLELDLNPNKVDLITQNFDLALRIGEQPDSGLICRRLGVVRTAIYAAPDYLDRVGRPTQPEDLRHLSVIRNQNAPGHSVWPVTDGRQTVEVPVGGTLLVNNFGIMRQLAVLGLGVAMLHEPMVVEDLRRKLLERVLPDWYLREAPVNALMPSRLLPAKTRLFLELLARRMSTQLDSIGRAPTIPLVEHSIPTP